MADLIQIGIDVNTNIKQATADLDKMGGSVLGNIQTFDRLEREVKQLDKAMAKNKITQKAYNRGIKQINGELLVFQQRAAKAAQVERKFGAGAASGGKSMNRFNVALQQGGFQLQDFAVQMQSGTSFFTAFGQQGSQFAGIFGPTGAVAGALIAIGSAIGGMALESFMASMSIKTLEESLTGMQDALSEFESSMALVDKYELSALSDNLTDMESSMLSLSKTSAELARNMVFVDALGSMKDLNLEVGFFAYLAGTIGNAFKDVGVQIDQAKRKAEQIRELQVKELKSFNFAEGLDLTKYEELLAAVKSGIKAQDPGAIIKATDELVASATADGVEKITEKGQALIRTLMDIATAQKALQEVENSSGLASEKVDAERSDRLGEMNTKLERSIAIAKLETDVIKEVAGAEKALHELKKNNAREDYEAKLKSAGATEAEILVKMANYNKLLEQADLLAAAVAAAKAAKGGEQGKQDALLASMKAENKLLILKILYAGDAVGLKRAEAKLAREAFKAEQVASKLSPEKIKLLMDEHDLRVSFTQDILDAVEATKLQDKATKEAAKSTKRLSDFGGSIEKKLVMATAKLKALKEGGDSANASMIAGLNLELETRYNIAYIQAAVLGDTVLQAKIQLEYNTALANTAKLQAILEEIDSRKGTVSNEKAKAQTIESVIKAMKDQVKQETKLIGLSKEQVKVEKVFNKLVVDNARLNGKKNKEELRAIAEVIVAQRKVNKTYEESIEIVKSISDAFSDFVVDGLKDFSSFADSIKNMFKKLLTDMISIALQNKIMIPITTGFMAGMGNTAAQAAGGGGMLGQAGSFLGNGLGSFGHAEVGGGLAKGGLDKVGPSGFLGGLGSAGSSMMSGFSSGGLSGGMSGLFNVAGNAGMAGGGAMATIGAVAAPVLALAAAISFFSTKVKELDSGLEGTITTMGATINSFRKVKKTRFWGLSSSTSETSTALGAETADPMIEAIQSIQKSVMDAAGEFGIAEEVFDNFSHSFRLSLKGLSEDARKAAIAEEFSKMGDAFTKMTGVFETLDELVEAATQRMGLQNRLDALLGNNAAILARQRKIEMEATHELNKELLQVINNLQDAKSAFANANAVFTLADQAVGKAFQVLRASIDAEKERLQSSAVAQTEVLKDAFNSIIDGLKLRLDVAKDVLRFSESVFKQLESASSGRSLSQGRDNTFARREGATNFLSAGNFEDEQRLKDALSIVGEPTEGLYATFIEYAREFGQTSAIIRVAKNVAEVQLSAAEEAVVVLERQTEAAKANHEAELVQAEGSLEAELAALDAQFTQQEAAYAALLGIDISIMSVQAAVANLAGVMAAAAAAQQAAADAAAAAAAQAAAQAADEAAAEAAALVTVTDAARFYGLDQTQQAASNDQAVQEIYDREGPDIDYGTTATEDAKERGFINEAQNSGGGGNSFTEAAADIVDTVSNAVESMWNSSITGRIVNSALDFFRGDTPEFATGGSFGGGMRLVGERGPELEATGPSRIFSNKDTAKMFSNPELVKEIRGLRSEVSGLRSEQRQMQATSSKYTKRNYDINRKWDTDGLPATRT